MYIPTDDICGYFFIFTFQSKNKMKHTYIALLFLLGMAAQAQQVTGYIYDKGGEPLPGAFVYLDGTTFSADTDEKGYFVLNTGNRNTGTLVASFIGFKTARVEDPFQYGNPIKIILEEDALEMQEVVIDAKTTFTRKQMLRAFREHFLGTSSVASSCKIENEDDIRLYYDSNTFTLRAEAKKPLRIKNKKLEYDVQFDLVAFGVQYRAKSLEKAYVDGSIFAGTTFFKDLSKNGSADKKRKNAYLGSATHLMKTIASQDWHNQGFGLYVNNFPASPHKHFTVTDTLNVKKVTAKAFEENGATITGTGKPGTLPATKKVQMPIRYNVLYKGKDQSVFVLNKGVFYVDSFGLYFPINEVMFGGHISDLKAGDMLPADYEYKE